MNGWIFGTPTPSRSTLSTSHSLHIIRLAFAFSKSFRPAADTVAVVFLVFVIIQSSKSVVW